MSKFLIASEIPPFQANKCITQHQVFRNICFKFIKNQIKVQDILFDL